MNIKYIAALSSLALLTGCATGPSMTDEESCALIGGAIDSMMFTFDDLVRLDGQGVQVLIRNVPKEQLLLALKGASENLRDLFFKNMSERAGKMFKEDLANIGPVRLREVDEAQAAVVVMAKDLAAQGQITLQEGREDEMVY